MFNPFKHKEPALTNEQFAEMVANALVELAEETGGTLITDQDEVETFLVQWGARKQDTQGDANESA